MEYVVGIALALLVCLGANWVGLDRDRAFYPTVLIVVASYYVLFAALGGDERALLADAAIAMAFGAMAVFGFRRRPWIIVAALFAHGVLDGFRPFVVHNAGVPQTWPAFCLSFDWAMAIALGWTLKSRAGHLPVERAIEAR